MTVGSLFAGIGGFDLGLERAGFTVRWQCEIDQFCRRVQDLVTAHGWRIHPNFTEALMGFPIGWSAIEASETLSRQT